MYNKESTDPQLVLGGWWGGGGVYSGAQLAQFALLGMQMLGVGGYTRTTIFNVEFRKFGLNHFQINQLFSCIHKNQQQAVL